MMKWIKQFLGLYDRAQLQRTEEVSDIVHEKKNQFTSDMAKIQLQSKRLHRQAEKTLEESGKLKDIVDDVTAKIAVATGRLR